MENSRSDLICLSWLTMQPTRSFAIVITSGFTSFSFLGCRRDQAEGAGGYRRQEGTTEEWCEEEVGDMGIQREWEVGKYEKEIQNVFALNTLGYIKRKAPAPFSPQPHPNINSNGNTAFTTGVVWGSYLNSWRNTTRMSEGKIITAVDTS